MEGSEIESSPKRDETREEGQTVVVVVGLMGLDAVAAPRSVVNF